MNLTTPTPGSPATCPARVTAASTRGSTLQQRYTQQRIKFNPDFLKSSKLDRILLSHFGIQMRLENIRGKSTQIKWQTLAKYLTIVETKLVASISTC